LLTQSMFKAFPPPLLVTWEEARREEARLEPIGKEVVMNAALACVKAEDWSGALAVLRPLFKSEPDNAKVLLLVGLCNYKLGSHAVAEKAYRKVRRVHSLRAFVAHCQVPVNGVVLKNRRRCLFPF
jgi:hypothetical protein